MTTTLEELLSKHPKAVKAINSAGRPLFPALGDVQAANCIHLYAAARGIGSPLDSVADLLAAIEAHITENEPLTDAEIEAMKWRAVDGATLCTGDTSIDCYSFEEAINAKRIHNKCIDRLHAEIRRLRKGEA